MHFRSRSALLASCIVISANALPVTYSVVDVDGGSAAGNAAGNQPATVYQTVTKSTKVEDPEPTTVSVSVTIVKTDHATASSTPSSTSSSTSLHASAQASSTAPAPSASTSTLDALSVLESATSTFLTSTKPASSAPPVITSAPSASDDEPDYESTIILTVTPAVGGTVTLFSTTTVTPAAEPTSYYDDGMWHTSYAIKPTASPEADQPPVHDHDAVPKLKKASTPVDGEQASDAPSNTSQAANGTFQAPGETNSLAPTATSSGVPAANASVESPKGTDAPLMLIQPLLPQATGETSHVAPSGDAAAPEVLSGDAETTTGQTTKRTPTYSVVSWNETTQG